MRFACRVTKSTNTHSGYVALFAFPRQQWLCEGASVIHYTTQPVLFKWNHLKTEDNSPTTNLFQCDFFKFNTHGSVHGSMNR